ncbi:MAG: hypothetical protein EOQ28_19430 [Mesorhizobium sp.]|nr:MAG: hypothetical protein EOQ28_19430 [Mesorhizobium sp.]RWB99401.1 MAG: hypothetical protein EOQ57_18960 [Mesorhizobium sp.]
MWTRKPRSRRRELQTLELASARLRLNQAELALLRAEGMLDERCGAVVGVALCCRIRGAQQRVSEARARLVKIDPASAHRLRAG